jgi:type II restriction/modification system DNA methylase subunit YeeA
MDPGIINWNTIQIHKDSILYWNTFIQGWGYSNSTDLFDNATNDLIVLLRAY